jgi:hypothetical protein
MGQFGNIDAVYLQRKGVPPAERAGFDSRLSWALVTYKLQAETYTEDHDSAQGCFSHAVAQAQSATVHHPRLPTSPSDDSDVVRLVVLPASRRVIGAHALEAASAQATVRLVLAAFTWIIVLFILSPVYITTWHEWSYMDAVWFTYTTMTGIGYGDLYPNSHPTSFQTTVLADLQNAENDHAVYVW